MMARSTRGGSAVSLQEAMDRGLAPGGGLYLPHPWPRLPEPPSTLGPEVADTAAWAAPLLLPGVLPPDEMEALVRDALDFPVPLAPLGERLALLELFHGPTLAFKDVGARFLARLWSRTASREVRQVLVATSGDTGGAVAQACHGLPGLQVAVLFPADRVSEIQRRQFTTLGGNVLAVAVEGSFDRCQALVKELLGRAEAAEEHGLTSANSINLGRLLPQVFYYLHLARLKGWGRGSVSRDPVVVPSGNLGNLCAGVLAVRAGAPLGPLVAACNRNDALVRHLEDGATAEVPVHRTLSTAMDVGAPSNLERLTTLFDGLGRFREGVRAFAVSDQETAATIWRAWRRWGRHLDPHTAVGVAVALRPEFGSEPATVLATAHAAKFPEVVEEASGAAVPGHESLERLRSLPERTVPLVSGAGIPELLDILDRFRPTGGTS